MENEEGEEVVLTTTPQEDVGLDTTKDEEENFDWKAEALKQREIAENQKIRAEKAEAKKKEQATVKETKTSTTSIEDLYALMKADVPQEDIADVKEYAQFKGISIAEALKTGTVHSILAERREQRIVATATNTGNSKRSSGKISDEALIANANAGKLPESQVDIDRLVALKMKGGSGRR